LDLETVINIVRTRKIKTKGVEKKKNGKMTVNENKEEVREGRRRGRKV
jgi:hypothetical protein